MNWMTAAAVAALVVLAPAARAAEARKDDARGAIAVELSRFVLTPETWQKTMQASSSQTSQQVALMVKQSGGSVDPEFFAIFDKEFSRMLPYQEILDMQAGLLAKHYTEAELRQLLAFYGTPLGQKMIRVMPEVAADVTAWTMTIMQQRITTVMDRVKSLVREGEGEQAPAAAEKQP